MYSQVSKVYEKMNANHQSNKSSYFFKTAQIFHTEEIRNICSQVKVDLKLPHSRHFLVNHERKLLYCWIHKAASTSWIALFSHLANRTHVGEYYR